LIASALMRMARVVDRAGILSAIAHEGTLDKIGITTDQLRSWQESHALRARYAERSITLLYAAIVVFISTCLSIALDRALGGSLGGFARHARDGRDLAPADRRRLHGRRITTER
jgi:hypothetical protein